VGGARSQCGQRRLDPTRRSRTRSLYSRWSNCVHRTRSRRIRFIRRSWCWSVFHSTPPSAADVRLDIKGSPRRSFFSVIEQALLKLVDSRFLRLLHIHNYCRNFGNTSNWIPIGLRPANMHVFVACPSSECALISQPLLLSPSRSGPRFCP